MKDTYQKKIMVGLIYFVLVLNVHFSFSAASSIQSDWKQLDLSSNGCSRSLDALREVSNKTVVTLGNCTYTLTSPLTISAVQGLHIIGNDSVINCVGENAGMMFKLVTDLWLKRITIRHCGMYLSEDKQQIASVQIKNSSNVTIRNVIIENGTGTGLSLVNVTSKTTVEMCIFRHNVYHIPQMYKVLNASRNDFVQRGGGMQILVGNGVNNTIYQVLKSKFICNFASSGGGLFAVIQYGTARNQIKITDSDFLENTCENDGGGVQIGYTTIPWQPYYQTVNNCIIFERCVIIGNEAGYGGGMSIFSSLGGTYTKNKIQLRNCSWLRNSATRQGMAVNIAFAPWEVSNGSTRYGLCPKPQFQDCNFAEHSYINSLSSPRSIFTVTGFEIFFERMTVFESNNGTAIDAMSAILTFMENVTAKFINNLGINGGAMNLKGLSSIFAHKNCTILFLGNSALRSGGAIYVDSSNRYSSSKCFIKPKGKGNKRNIFIFLNNTASSNKHRNRGNSIYASSILPCLDPCINGCYNNASISEAFQKIGKFEFDKSGSAKQLTTAPNHFSLIDKSNKDDTLCNIFMENFTIYYRSKDKKQRARYDISKIKALQVIPGKIVKIPLKLVDELCEEVFFHVTVEVVKSSNGSIFIINSIITDNFITLYGDPHDSGIIQFSTTGVRDVTLSVYLDDCPPGYIHDVKSKTCACSLSTKLHYPGIERCSTQEYKAYVKHGYWFGYVKNQTTQETLASAICPKGFCARNATEYPLPPEATNDLSSYICNRRTGIICGSCTNNYSTHYRSASFSCKSIHLCSLGWIFYIASEIIPVTVLFLIVIYFNISFTSGTLNGVILFVQIIDTLKTDGENFIQFSDTIIQFSRAYKIIYRAFLLKFFALEELSFCLWEGATTLDMLAFRYVTIVYSLFLVIITVFMLRKCTCRFGKAKDKMTKTSLNLKHSILNGLSAFLVMSYSECTQVTLMILTTGTLTVGPIESIYTSYKYESVAFYNGNYRYMGRDHLKYALPAIAFLLTLVALPPILLIVYPLCYKLFALLRIDESKFAKVTCKVFPLEKIKPLFDSIQGDFKDEYRFFAGLYFIYRLCISVTFTYASALKYYYFATNIQLIITLVLHSICFPYKKKWHNILDSILFANLAVINAIAWFNYASSNRSVIVNLAGIQCGLILLPLVYLVVYTIYNIVKKIKPKMTISTHQDDTRINDNNLNDILEMLDTRNAKDSENYVLLNKS